MFLQDKLDAPEMKAIFPITYLRQSVTNFGISKKKSFCEMQHKTLHAQLSQIRNRLYGLILVVTGNSTVQDCTGIYNRTCHIWCNPRTTDEVQHMPSTMVIIVSGTFFRFFFLLFLIVAFKWTKQSLNFYGWKNTTRNSCTFPLTHPQYSKFS